MTVPARAAEQLVQIAELVLRLIKILPRDWRAKFCASAVHVIPFLFDKLIDFQLLFNWALGLISVK